MSEMDYGLSAVKQDSLAPCEQVAMTPDVVVWVFGASFHVTRCPTFKIGYAIFWLVQDTLPSKMNPSCGLEHMHKSDSCVELVYAVHHMYSA